MEDALQAAVARRAAAVKAMFEASREVNRLRQQDAPASGSGLGGVASTSSAQAGALRGGQPGGGSGSEARGGRVASLDELLEDGCRTYGLPQGLSKRLAEQAVKVGIGGNQQPLRALTGEEPPEGAAGIPQTGEVLQGAARATASTDGAERADAGAVAGGRRWLDQSLGESVAVGVDLTGGAAPEEGSQSQQQRRRRMRIMK